MIVFLLLLGFVAHAEAAANLTPIAMTHGAKAAAGKFACYSASFATGIAASGLGTIAIKQLNLDPYAEEATLVGLDFIVGMLTPRFCFPAGALVWVVDAETGELIQVPIE